jgi:hypothetical protein
MASDQDFLAQDPGNPAPGNSPVQQDPGSLQSDPSSGDYAGSDKPETAAPRAQLVTPEDKANYALKSATERYNAAKAREDAADARLQSQYNEMQATIARNSQSIREAEANRPQLQTLETTQPTPTQQQNIGNILGNVAAMVAIGAAIFGRHHGGGYGNAITQAGIGAFLKNFAAGRQEQSKEIYNQWKESQALIDKNNADKIKQYNEVLADRRLDLSEQHAQLAELGYYNGNSKVAQAATQKAYGEVTKQIQILQKAADARRVAAQKAVDGINKTLLKQEKEKAEGKKITDFPVNVTPSQAKQLPKDAEFYGKDGVHYKVKVPGEQMQLDIIKDQDDAAK